MTDKNSVHAGEHKEEQCDINESGFEQDVCMCVYEIKSKSQTTAK